MQSNDGSRSLRRRVVLAAATVIAVALLAAPSASGARGMLVGLYDEPETFGNANRAFPVMRTLRTQVVRVNLYWGSAFGRAGTGLGVAKRRPTDATNPDDKAYDWSLYDRTIRSAARHRMKVVLAIYGTPGWANRGNGPNVPPARMTDLRDFAYAAATRYSGTYVPTGSEPDAEPLPAVRHWLAWNEPNNPVFLRRQYRKVAGRWVMQGAIDYARICNSVYTGVKSTFFAAQKVACGVTAPRGNNVPRSSRASVSPLAFLRATKKAGMKRFDAYAHHPYYGSVLESPSTKPKAKTAVGLGNLDDLVKELTRLYGKKRLWITEYGYQTRPPDRYFGVTFAQQAAYLRQSFAIARKHPRVDMMLWFLLRDQRELTGWQSGLMTLGGKKKPAFAAFQHLPR
jgi:putative glycosyl hydrolase